MKTSSSHMIGKTADLLRSLHDSIFHLRNEAEALRLQFQAEHDLSPETAQSKPQIAKLEALIRDCQKVEKTLVEQSSDTDAIAPAGPEIDFEATRAEIHGRLARLRASVDTGPLSE